MLDVIIEPRPFDHPDVADFVERIQQLYQEMYGGNDEDPTEAAQFTPPQGLFLIGYLDGAAVASGGWRRHDLATAEIKRMYVASSVRGGGVGRRMLAELERTAAAQGVSRITLNTGHRQADAIALYEAHGYVRTDRRFGHYERMPGACFFAKNL